MKHKGTELQEKPRRRMEGAGCWRRSKLVPQEGWRTCVLRKEYEQVRARGERLGMGTPYESSHIALSKFDPSLLTCAV